MRRAGFTLLELLVAVVLTGVVALLVYGAAGAAMDTQARLEAQRLETRSERAWRATLEDALRNARPARAYGDTAFVLEERRDAEGRPRDRLWFVTAGGLPPLTADADWEVLIEPTPQGLSLLAQPLGVNTPPRRLFGPREVTGLDVRLLSPLPGQPGWLDSWAFPRIVPEAIELTYWADAGPVGPPVVLTLPLGLVE
ncbi:MAG: prepilin-type N-terminal cleavage/methylation domain-containing protein [Gemmatimonadota bacterium]|nr:MAG: prepilin-type N-terminal cleavage/methylation domain-containing protein [Gemmatimonadota bacterium]